MLMRPELRGTRGAVSATHWLASAAGAAVFDRGGNAFDAATAAAFVTQVVEPHLNGPASDVPVLVHPAGSGRVDVVCGQGPMPAGGTPEYFRGLGLDVIPGSGLLPAVVPGAFGAWARVLAEYGTLSLSEALEPAIGYADRGYPILPKAAEMIGSLEALFLDEWAESGRTYLQAGKVPAGGSLVRNPDLAATFRRLVAEGEAAGGSRENRIEGAVRAFYEGFVADAIDAFVPRTPMIDSTGGRHHGLVTGADLAGWRATVERSIARDYRGLEVHKPGPWSQGPVFLQQLALLEDYDLGAMGFGSADHLHTVVECAKLAFADREAWYGDPLHADVPLETLLSRQYADARRALVGADASAELRPGTPDGRQPYIPPVADAADVPADPAWMAQIADGVPAVVARTAAKGDTCCITATDADGNMVVASPSGGWLKSSPVVPGLGFPLGTRGQMAWLADGHANTVAPGKRPRTTLSPTLVLRDGAPYLAFGTPGGDQQDQWTLNFLLNHVDHGLGPQEAIERTGFHSDHVPSSFTPRTSAPRRLVVERGLGSATLDELRARGHEVAEVAPYSLGKVCATGHAEGTVLAAASPRGQQAYAVAR